MINRTMVAFRAGHASFEVMRKWLVFAAGLLAFGVVAAPVNLNQVFELDAGKTTVRFNPVEDGDLRRLGSQVKELLRMPEDESKHTRRGLEEIERLTGAALASPGPPEREQLETDLVETVLAVNNNERPTIPRHFDPVMAPVALLQFVRPIGLGNKPAVNLRPGPSDDLSRRDPLPSSFWSPPADIAAEDLYDGFGRTALPGITGKLWRYAVPKETSGMNPGFEADCDWERVKLKFGEFSSEPLVTRMFWALGFHADPTDYAAGVKVAYDRRIFTEFNSRQPVRTTFTLFWIIPIYTMDLQRHKDPFNYVAAAVLRDGRRWSGSELKRHLMAGTNFQPAVEAQLDYIVTTPANVQVKDPQVKSIGPWDYGQLDHADRREVRGAGLLAAWLGFYDTRFDNTKLRRVGSKKHPQLVHYFSDLGGGLGRTTGLIAWHGEDVNAFPWTFTEPPLAPVKGRPGQPLRIVGYTPIVRTPAFAAMTIDDARWMARLIGQLRPGQIIRALTASGYDDATVRLYAQKLISRRNKMMADLGLSGEIPPLALE
jgi:hypothetical protein